ncbi:coat protein [Wuhan fly virus 6]|nr:coat protein [Wuhan fly virus 6]
MSSANNNNKAQAENADNSNRTGENPQASKGQLTGKKNNNRGRNNPGRKKFNDQRAQQMREKRGQENVDAYNDKIKEKWISGVETAEKLEARMKETANQRAQMLSISTRGVGVNLLTSIFTTTAYKNDIPTPNVYSLYRVALAVIEAKVQSLKPNYPIPPRFSEDIAQLNNSADFERVCRSVVFLPKPITTMVNSIGIVKNGNSIYIPTFCKDLADSEDRFVPTPEGVRFSNLRQVVTTLADPATPRQYRDAFYARNCIPGAKWNENHILMNADEIMPNNYGTEDLSRDSIRITPWMSNVQKHVPKLVGGTVSFESTGRRCLFICNDQESLRLPDRNMDETIEQYIQRAIPEGNIKTFHTPYELTAAERLDGQLGLLGERPIYFNLRIPIYTHRLESRCEYEFAADYLSALQLSFGF